MFENVLDSFENSQNSLKIHCGLIIRWGGGRNHLRIIQNQTWQVRGIINLVIKQKQKKQGLNDKIMMSSFLWDFVTSTSVYTLYFQHNQLYFSTLMFNIESTQ